MNIPGYKIEHLIAEGGMAAVYLAIQESLNRQVALKVLKKFDGPGQSSRFMNEGRIIASLNHRNIITIHDIGVINDQHYISMEYLEDGDLDAQIQSGMNPAIAIDLIKTIGTCLDYVHGKGIVHRDIKPANILFRGDGTPILTDFGIAKQLSHDTRLTTDGAAMGSPDYLSPEQAECRVLDGRADIYGLGIVLYEMLTGKKPYQGGSYIATVMAHITEPIPSLPHHLVRYQDLLERMIAKEPEERFDSAADMVAFIERIGKPSAVERVSAGLSNLACRLRDSVSATTMPCITMQTNRHEPEQNQAESTPGIAPDNLHAIISRVTTRVRKINPRWLLIGVMVSAVVLSAWMTGMSPKELSIHNEKNEIEQHLLKADAAMDMNKLTVPDLDNAYFYYQNVLNLDPENEEAHRGLQEIATRFADLAEHALDKYEYDKARHYVREGLRVQPEDKRLVALQQRTNVIKDVSTRLVKGVKSIFGR